VNRESCRAAFTSSDTIIARQLPSGLATQGGCHDTPEFAADNLVRWWCDEGEALYPEAIEFRVLADGGGTVG
jgi:hypothetical protein